MRKTLRVVFFICQTGSFKELNTKKSASYKKADFYMKGETNMKINWKVRAKNPWFWIGLVAMFFCAINVDASTLTSWQALLDSLKNFIGNPYLIGAAMRAIITYIQDPTTAGISDSKTALSYRKPKKEE